MYTLLHKKIKGKPYSIRHYRGFPKLFLENQALLGFHEAKTGVECGSWADTGLPFEEGDASGLGLFSGTSGLHHGRLQRAGPVAWLTALRIGFRAPLDSGI